MSSSVLGISLGVVDLFLLLLALLQGMLGQDQSQSQAGEQSPDAGTETVRMIRSQVRATIYWFTILGR